MKTVVSRQTSAFTLVETLVVISILTGLFLLAQGGLVKLRSVSESAQCSSNLRQLAIATGLYLTDNNNRLIPYYEDLPDGRLWYFGFEGGTSQGGAEGDREVDMTRSPLYTYIQQVGGVEICPSFPYGNDYWKPKFKGASYGYGYNVLLSPLQAKDPSKRWSPKVPTPLHLAKIQNPSQVILFGDCAQVNSFQAPASASNPLLEEFYFIDDTYRTVHFRHGTRANMVFLDGHVESFGACQGTLDTRLESELIGRITPRGSTTYLK